MAKYVSHTQGLLDVVGVVVPAGQLEYVAGRMCCDDAQLAQQTHRQSRASAVEAAGRESTLAGRRQAAHCVDHEAGRVRRAYQHSAYKQTRDGAAVGGAVVGQAGGAGRVIRAVRIEAGRAGEASRK